MSQQPSASRLRPHRLINSKRFLNPAFVRVYISFLLLVAVTMQTALNHRHAQPHITNASTRPHHYRARSSSDPFIDPVYHAPNLSYEKAHSRSVPPALPPKPPKKTTAMREPRDQRPLESAVRDAVTVRNVNDQSPRNYMNRSKTG